MPKPIARGVSKDEFEHLVLSARHTSSDLVRDEGGGHDLDDTHIGVAITRTSLVISGALVMVVPWSVLLVAEEVTRSGQDSTDDFRVRMFGWSYLSLIYSDVMRFSSYMSPFSEMRWRFPEHVSYDSNSQNKPLVVLTIDDAPGDNPEQLGLLLDTLKSLKATATFFCTTNYINDDMRPLMWRIVNEGHEVANHCPEDKPYSRLSEKSFEKELMKSSLVLKPFYEKQDHNRLLNSKRNRNYSKLNMWRWFRPPQGNMSKAMSNVLKKKNYSNVLGDCFSNDVFVGGSLKNATAGPATIAYHTNYCMSRVRPGSISIFHVPQKNERLFSREVIESFIKAVSEKNMNCVSLSDLARNVELNSTG